MKKMTAVLAALALLCASCAAVADMEIPSWDNMPDLVMEDENTTVNEAMLEGEWVLNAAFAGTEYITPEVLQDTYGFDYVPYTIGGGKITHEIEDENGEFHSVEVPYILEAGQLQGTDENGRLFTVEPLEDGNIVLSVFYPGEGDEIICVSIFMVHPAA